MPRILDSFPERGHKRWAALTDGKTREFTHDEITNTITQFQSSAHAAAKYHGMKARTAQTDDGIAVQFYIQ